MSVRGELSRRTASTWSACHRQVQQVSPHVLDSHQIPLVHQDKGFPWRIRAASLYPTAAGADGQARRYPVPRALTRVVMMILTGWCGA